MTNGMPIVLKADMKPLPTLYHPLRSVDIKIKIAQKAQVERSDTTDIVPASIVVENVVAIEIAKVITETFVSSHLNRLKQELAAYREELRQY